MNDEKTGPIMEIIMAGPDAPPKDWAAKLRDRNYEVFRYFDLISEWGKETREDLKALKRFHRRLESAAKDTIELELKIQARIREGKKS